MNAPMHNKIKFAGNPKNKPGMAGADLTPGAPAIHLCPKCGHAMRRYVRTQTGQVMLQCMDRKGCNLRLPLTDAPAPDTGLTGLKAAPDVQRDGLAGLRAV